MRKTTGITPQVDPHGRHNVWKGGGQPGGGGTPTARHNVWKGGGVVRPWGGGHSHGTALCIEGGGGWWSAQGGWGGTQVPYG